MKNKEQSLWQNSPCTLPYATKNFLFDKQQRFKRFSIYYRDDVNKAKKIFNDIQRPELLLIKFRKQIQEASSARFKIRNKFNEAKEEKYNRAGQIDNIKLPPTKTQTIIDRLYQIKSKQDMKYDRYGFRSNLPVQNGQQLNLKMKSLDVNRHSPLFTRSRRIDLGLPLNYNPSPNKYNGHKPFLSQKNDKWGRSRSSMKNTNKYMSK